MSNSSSNGVTPRVLKVAICKSIWKAALRACAYVMLIFSGPFALFAIFADPSRAIPFIGVFVLILGIPFSLVMIPLLIINFWRVWKVRKELTAQTPLNDLHGEDWLTRRITEIGLDGCRNIPERLQPPAGLTMPSAIIIDNAKLPVLPVPPSHNIPFEPLPLGRDPDRSWIYLEEFVGVDPSKNFIMKSHYQRYKMGKAKSVLVIFQWIVRCLLGVWLFVILIGWRRLGSWGSAVFALWLATIILPVFIRNWDWGYPRCWLFPGTIAFRPRRLFRSKHPDILIARQGTGTLWYDAHESRIHIPLENNRYYIMRVPPQDALLVIWAWLNTAAPPEEIHLDGIA